MLGAAPVVYLDKGMFCPLAFTVLCSDIQFMTLSSSSSFSSLCSNFIVFIIFLTVSNVQKCTFESGSMTQYTFL